MVDLLLDGAGREQAVDGDRSVLPDAPRAFPRLHVRAGVPVGVEDEHAVGAGQVDAETTHTRRQQEDEQVGVLRGTPSWVVYRLAPVVVSVFMLCTLAGWVGYGVYPRW